ncbi:hypothetical protein [Xanthomonas phage JGB6]|nr:hypothetical protein [Xanthomonas phage JGB6]
MALTGLIEDEKRGLITKAEAKTAIKAIFESVSGLIDQETFDFLSAASVDYKDSKGMDITFVKVEETIQGTIRVCGNGALMVYKAVPIRAPQYNTHEEVDAEAKTIQQEMHQKLLNRVSGSW